MFDIKADNPKYNKMILKNGIIVVWVLVIFVVFSLRVSKPENEQNVSTLIDHSTDYILK